MTDKRQNNLNPKILNPNARSIGVGVTRRNVSIKPETVEQAKIIGGDNVSAGIDRAVEASGSLSNFKSEIKAIATDTLKTLDFAVQSLSKMPHQILGSERMDQKSIDADVLRWTIQRELDSRKAGELPYSWSEMYLAMGIPKEFLA